MHRHELVLNVTNSDTFNTKKYTFITDNGKYLQNRKNRAYVLFTYVATIRPTS